MESTPFSGSDSLSPAALFPCTTGNCASSSSSVAASSVPVLTEESILANSARVEDRVTDGTSMDQLEEENDWFGYKPDISDDLGMLHGGLDMINVDDCPSAFAGESVCNTIDLDTIVDLGLNTADLMTVIRSRHGDGQPEIILGQSCFTDSTSKAVDPVIGGNLLQCKDAIGGDPALNTTSGLQFDTPSMKTETVQRTSISSDVPFCLASNVPLLSPGMCELATSFLTPKTPTQSQGLPTYATHFSFSLPDVSQAASVSVSRPKTPVVSVSLPVRAHLLLSPHTPYTPDTPSMFQFPSPNLSPASSTGCSPASRHSKRHTANYHPYISPSATATGPCYPNQQNAVVQRLEQQQRLEMEVADNEIDQYIRQLKQADLQQQQPLHVPDTCPQAMSSKLSLTLPAETSVSSGANNVSGSAASCQRVASPIEEVIQILVAEHFGVTVSSKLRLDDLKRAAQDSKVCTESSGLQTCTDEGVAEEFRNPDTLPASKPRKRKPEPLVIPPCVSNFGYRSQLRSPKLLESGSATQQCSTTTPPPYTPPPMITPARTGSGVFWTLHGARQVPAGPLSAPPCRTSFSCMYDVHLCLVITLILIIMPFPTSSSHC